MKKVTVKDLLEAKGKSKLSQINVHTVDNARACEAADIEMMITWDRSPIEEFRSAAPNTFFTAGMVYGEQITEKDALSAAFDLLSKGADGIYFPGRIQLVEALASEGIPVHGHIGFVPYKKTWSGGFKGVGKTAFEANKLLQRARDYENAGAIAIEVELVPPKVAKVITDKVTLLTVSMGSGTECDAQYLFAKDILGINEGHIPRHAKVYRNQSQVYRELYNDSVQAFREFKSEVQLQTFPSKETAIQISQAEYDKFCESLN